MEAMWRGAAAANDPDDRGDLKGADC